jgi:hypothetical protein
MPAPIQLKPRPLLQRVAWFVALWAGGVASVTAVSLLVRLWIAPT